LAVGTTLAAKRTATRANTMLMVVPTPTKKGVVFSMWTLVWVVLLLILANRQAFRFTGWQWHSRNPWLGRMALAMLGLLAAVLALPGLGALMGMALPALCAVWLYLLCRLPR
jgi:hypothetical protein